MDQRKWFVAWLVGVAAATLTACAARYQPKGFWGDGYASAQLDANTFLVEYTAGPSASRLTVQSYLLYRCAELTLEMGYDYFVIVGGKGDQRTVVTSPGGFGGFATTPGSMVYGPWGHLPGQTVTFSDDGAIAMIKLFRGEKPADNPAAFSGRELLSTLGTQIRH